MSKNTTDAVPLIKLGDLFLQTKSYSKAKDAFARALEKNSSDTNLQEKLAESKLHLTYAKEKI